MTDKFDIALASIGSLIALMAVAYLVSGPVALLAVGILAIATMGHVMFRMGVGLEQATVSD